MLQQDHYFLINKWIIEIIVCTWNLALTISLLTKLHTVKKQESKINQRKTPKTIYYSAIASFLGFPICYTIKLIVYMVNPPVNNSIKTLNLTVVWFSFAVSRLSFYIFILTRLYHSFHSSETYKLSKYTLYAHIFIILITPISIAIMILLEGINISDTYYIIGSILCILMLLIGSLHILYTFNNKLYLVIAENFSNTVDINTTESTTHMDAMQSKLRTQPRKLTHKIFIVIVKNTILTCITIVMFICIIVFYFIFSFIELNVMQWTVLAYLQVITINIASLCIYLSFNVNNKIYKLFCLGFQGKCELLCKHLINNRSFKINRKHVRHINMIKVNIKSENQK
eukprot:275992_1